MKITNSSVELLLKMCKEKMKIKGKRKSKNNKDFSRDGRP